MSRNPPWNRDELILALDLYMRRRHPSVPGPKDPDVIDLSEVLNRMARLDVGADQQGDFRNPNGVSMKLGNYLRFDDSYDGEGLKAGNRLEGEVWKEYASDLPKLQRTAAAIRTGIDDDVARQPAIPEGEENEYPEGRILYRLHRARERNAKVVNEAKSKRLKATGALRCDVCSFDFSSTYGERGGGYIEAHHKVPVSELERGAKTKVADLALVCANCHRMLHRKPATTVEALASDLQARR